MSQIWQACLQKLQQDIDEQDFFTWIRPLQAQEESDQLTLYAPNQFVIDWLYERFYEAIESYALEEAKTENFTVKLQIGSPNHTQADTKADSEQSATPTTSKSTIELRTRGNNQQTSTQDPFESDAKLPDYDHNLNRQFTFANFVKGKSNEFAYAATRQVAESPGGSYNPMFIYGGVGLGKTHLMHAVGNQLLEDNAQAKILYIHSERFVANMVKALQTNTMEKFKRIYRNVDLLLIDDIQFFAGKDRSQEEFFHTFNALLENYKQIILTCDRYPKEVNGLEERLKSRFGWGLTVAVEPPELETRVAILKSKAERSGVNLSNEVAFFIAKRIRSNVRELEGALKRVIANAEFTGRPITIDFVKDALRDLLALQDKLVTIDNIQKTVAEYFKVKVSDMLSKRRSRSVARPRQMAMTLAKELTNHSLPEIGNAFGGRDHTTVMHASRKIKELVDSDTDIAEDYQNLIRTLSS